MGVGDWIMGNRQCLLWLPETVAVNIGHISVLFCFYNFLLKYS